MFLCPERLESYSSLSALSEQWQTGPCLCASRLDDESCQEQRKTPKAILYLFLWDDKKLDVILLRPTFQIHTMRTDYGNRYRIIEKINEYKVIFVEKMESTLMVCVVHEVLLHNYS